MTMVVVVEKFGISGCMGDELMENVSVQGRRKNGIGKWRARGKDGEVRGDTSQTMMVDILE